MKKANFISKILNVSVPRAFNPITQLDVLMVHCTYKNKIGKLKNS